MLESSEQGVLRLDLSKGQIIMDHYKELYFILSATWNCVWGDMT